MTTKGKAYEGQFFDESAVWLEWGQYEAAILPGVGANLIAFRDHERKLTILREPAADEMNDFRANPGVHGIPVLFPPNRYEDGKFTFNGVSYQFPVNEAATGNHLHGFFHTASWQVEEYNVTSSESYAVLSITINQEHDIYQYLPHEFTLKLRYSLSDLGLSQQVIVHNHGPSAMPCMIAFHTAINAPFAEGSTSEDYTYSLTIKDRWELNERMLPTGRYQPLTAEEAKMSTTGLNPFWEAMDNHYTSSTKNGRNMMELTDNRLGLKLIYDVGTAYKQWMIWNNNAGGKFFCPEPQLNLVNAPNSTLPAEEIGLVTLEPGQIWEETSRLYIIKA
ncbi:aldose 1-epimerase [Paenibacillus septentrionalis]|uniref:Aldose 1-epimerase n=1 Tax=Paenibacillus septentrionalis TaxID=429342 RepID=A0ABW1V9Y4_9BACL